MKRNIAIGMAVAALSACLVLPLSAQGNEPSWAGSASARFGLSLPGGDPRGLGEFETRLVFEGGGEGLARFRAEGGYRTSYGAASDLALAFDAGLAPVPDPRSLAPGSDLHGVMFLDQAYGTVGLGPLGTRFGIIPAGGGAAWLYNPTSRIAPLKIERDPSSAGLGVPGLNFSLSLPWNLDLEAGAYALPRTGSAVPELGELSADGMPLSFRLSRRAAAADLAVSAVRERVSAGENSRWWLGADAGFDAYGVSWYAEGALRGAEEGEAAPAWSRYLSGEGLAAESALGFMYPLPLEGLELRSEYLWFSSGAASPKAYDPALLLSGEAILLARSYLFASLQAEDTQGALWKLMGGGMVNLNDRSFLLLGEGTWSPAGDVELRLETSWCLGPSGGEFTAPYEVAPGQRFRPWSSSAALACKVWF